MVKILNELKNKQIFLLALFIIALVFVSMFVFFEGYRLYLNFVIEQCKPENVECLTPLDNLLPSLHQG